MTIGFSRFGKQFASAGTVNALTDAQAAAGWNFLGTAPPTVEEFNAMMQTFDDKDNWLFQNIQTLVTAAASAAPADGVFTALQSALNALYAGINGSTSKTFSVAQATVGTQAPQLQQMTGRTLRVSVYINNAGTLQVSIDGAAFVNASTTFIPLSATTAVEVEGIGGGGAGGGALATGANQSAAGTGGSAGGWFRKRLLTGFSGASIAVGAPGVGAAGAAGGSGASTTFGTGLTAPGGVGGNVGSAVANTTSNFVGGTPSPIGTGGDLNGAGDSGKPGFISTTPVGGAGGNSPYGAGAVISSGTSSGNTSNSFGAGGGGACLAANNNFNAAGGNPQRGGVLIVKELS